MTPRPRSLAEVAERAESTQEFRHELADFLHEFKLRSAEPLTAPQMLASEPQLLRQRLEDGAIWDAYLAATADELALSAGQNPPTWTRRPERFLRDPWFASQGRHMRALLLLESPGPFRERNLFVTANALSVA